MENVLVREVNGMGTPEDVLERISEILGEWNLVPRKQYKDISKNIKINYTSQV
jgi:hypothetical protein